MTPTDTTTTAASSADVSNVATCPACGSSAAVLFTVTLDYDVDGGYRADHFGVTPQTGDTITRCDHCGAFFVHNEDGTLAGYESAPSTTEIHTSSESGEGAAAEAAAARLEALAKLEAALPAGVTIDEALAEMAKVIAPLASVTSKPDLRTGPAERRVGDRRTTTGTSPTGTERRSAANRVGPTDRRTAAESTSTSAVPDPPATS